MYVDHERMNMLVQANKVLLKKMILLKFGENTGHK